MQQIVFLINSDTHRVTGGLRFIYRTAQALHRAGMAVALGATSGTVPGDIAGEPLDCPKLTLRQVADLPPERRILVIPDDLLMRFFKVSKIQGVRIVFPAGKFVLLSQNRRDIMKTFVHSWPRGMDGQSLATHPNCLGHVTVSPAESQVWQALYPHLRAWVVPNSVDAQVFQPGPKKPLIVYGVKGGMDEFESRNALLMIRQARLFQGYAIKYLLGLTQTELAGELAQASIYLQASQYESFGLLAAEAMAAGCLFAGSDGGSDAGFLHGEWSYRCAPCDPLGLLQALRRLDSTLRQDPALIAQHRQMGRAFVQTHYPPESQTRQAIAAFQDIIAQAG